MPDNLDKLNDIAVYICEFIKLDIASELGRLRSILMN